LKQVLELIELSISVHNTLAGRSSQRRLRVRAAPAEVKGLAQKLAGKPKPL